MSDGRVYYFPPGDGVNVGMGFDITTGASLGVQAFDVDEAAMKSTSVRGFDVTQKTITDASSNEEAISLAANINGSGWGYSASLSANSSETKHFNCSSLGLMFVGSSDSKVFTVHPSQPLSETAARKLNEGIEVFHRIYGTHFVAGFKTGGGVIGGGSYQFTSAEAAKSLMAKFTGSYSGVVKVDADASFESAMDSSNTHGEFTGHLHVVGANWSADQHFDSPSDLHAAAIEAMAQLGTAADLPQTQLIVWPWTMIDQVLDADTQGPAGGSSDQSPTGRAAAALMTLDYVDRSLERLATADPGNTTVQSLEARSGKVRTLLLQDVKSYLAADSEQTGAVAEQIDQHVAAVDVLLPNLEGAITFEVGVSAMYATWGGVEPLQGSFLPNRSYPALLYLASADAHGQPHVTWQTVHGELRSVANFDLRFGEVRDLARFGYPDTTERVMSVQLDNDETGRLRIQTYLGPTNLRDDAFAGGTSGHATSQVAEFGVKSTDWTPDARPPSDTSRQYYIAARIQGPATS